ncbi:Holliday junction branch migration protein RuvA [candidate division TA06 bacterium]|nr:Holliday junction branch migration protein RuvA [candidate division TA06 bacterium]
MISYLKGKLVEKSPISALIDVGGVGYMAKIPLSTFETLGNVGEKVTILTHLTLRDDHMELYGFSTPVERDLFISLLSVSGIGNKSALSILSGTSVKQFKAAVARGDKDFLSTIHGIGKKTAERITFELRDRFREDERGLSSEMEGALQALLTLGFKPEEARQALERVEPNGRPLEEIIREALKKL